MNKSLVIKVVVPFFIICAASIGAYVMVKMKEPPEQEVVTDLAFLVQAEEVIKEPIEFVIESQGNVLPRNQTSISTQVSGKVVSIAPVFQSGGFFRRGDILVTLEKDDYETDLKLAEAELAQTQAALEEEIARGKVAEQEWRSVNNTVPPALGLRKPQLAKEQANVKASEAKYERAKRNLARTEIRAPYNGVVITRDVDVGQFLPIGSVVGEVFSTDIAEVRLPLASSDLAFLDLRAGVDAGNSVSLRATVAGQEQTWRGNLVRSEGVMDAGSRVIYAVVEVVDPYQLEATGNNIVPLRFGQFVQAVISGTRTEDVVVLPRNLLRLDNTIITVTQDREIALAPVKVARSDAERVYISHGLSSGDLVAVSAVPNAFNGMKVRLPEDEPDIQQPSRNDQAENDGGFKNVETDK